MELLSSRAMGKMKSRYRVPEMMQNVDFMEQRMAQESYQKVHQGSQLFTFIIIGNMLNLIYWFATLVRHQSQEQQI